MRNLTFILVVLLVSCVNHKAGEATKEDGSNGFYPRKEVQVKYLTGSIHTQGAQRAIGTLAGRLLAVDTNTAGAWLKKREKAKGHTGD